MSLSASIVLRRQGLRRRVLFYTGMLIGTERLTHAVAPEGSHWPMVTAGVLTAGVWGVVSSRLGVALVVGGSLTVLLTPIYKFAMSEDAVYLLAKQLEGRFSGSFGETVKAIVAELGEEKVARDASASARDTEKERHARQQREREEQQAQREANIGIER
jgi:hypothetical protein